MGILQRLYNLRSKEDDMIIGITGTLGAGKGTIVAYLVKQHNFRHFSVRAYIVEEIERRGMPVNRDTMTLIGNELRAGNSPSYIADQLYKQAQTAGDNAIIESLRTPGEVQSLRQHEEFYLFAVDADREVRYNRIHARKSATDNVSFEKFKADEEREMHTTDPNKQNLSACLAMADYTFNNDTSIEELHNHIKEALHELQKNP